MGNVDTNGATYQQRRPSRPQRASDHLSFLRVSLALPRHAHSSQTGIETPGSVYMQMSVFLKHKTLLI